MEGFGETQRKPVVTEEKKESFDKQQKMEQEKREGDFAGDTESGGRYFSSVTSNGNKYSETIALNHEGEIDRDTFMDNAGRNILERARSVDLNRGGLDKLISGIKRKFKYLDFSLDENGDQLIFTVESKIKKNTFVKWVNQGVNQWPEPRRIVHVSEDGLFAFFDGSMTGVPVDQLEGI